jgi:hypothetical protein
MLKWYQVSFTEHACLTDGGADPGQPCALPFKFKAVTYNKCTWDHAEDGRAWCSTLVDGNQRHVGGKGKWGRCGPGCSNSEKGKL